MRRATIVLIAFPLVACGYYSSRDHEEVIADRACRSVARSDHDIAADVRHALGRLDVDDTRLLIVVADGRVALAGVVATPSERRRVAQAAWVEGVLAVDAEGLSPARHAKE